ncbi:unnamed protein product [Prorocentrum cordatum]|uniref:Anaphase-promoting complex subunit 1 n=1 Tax=Prorocentrum cordatum TaxID=2364126 RepID=A0ABN9R3T8_9DINO|nr:unnamed protein product [Polarella glacialis]
MSGCFPRSLRLQFYTLSVMRSQEFNLGATLQCHSWPVHVLRANLEGTTLINMILHECHSPPRDDGCQYISLAEEITIPLKLTLVHLPAMLTESCGGVIPPTLVMNSGRIFITTRDPTNANHRIRLQPPHQHRERLLTVCLCTGRCDAAPPLGRATPNDVASALVIRPCTNIMMTLVFLLLHGHRHYLRHFMLPASLAHVKITSLVAAVRSTLTPTQVADAIYAKPSCEEVPMDMEAYEPIVTHTQGAEAWRLVDYTACTLC